MCNASRLHRRRTSVWVPGVRRAHKSSVGNPTGPGPARRNYLACAGQAAQCMAAVVLWCCIGDKWPGRRLAQDKRRCSSQHSMLAGIDNPRNKANGRWRRARALIRIACSPPFGRLGPPIWNAQPLWRPDWPSPSLRRHQQPKPLLPKIWGLVMRTGLEHGPHTRPASAPAVPAKLRIVHAMLAP